MKINERDLLRKEYRAKREQLSEEERRKKSGVIIKKLTSLLVYHEARIILTYIEYGSEVRTSDWVEFALSEGEKRIFCPKVTSDSDNDKGDYRTAEMEFFEITTMKQLTEGYRGISEPESRNSQLFSKEFAEQNRVLMVIPGLVFDPKGGRLGYGGGFYDHYRKRSYLSAITTVALAFDCQIYKEVPFSDNDIKTDMLITETNAYTWGG
ncbi:MAG: 5-formyltetrahydrofolate cyclo-ligase [Lachnospiraceae bacterium]|jgi:5-formyltetrahydrofolate cyclo-ligase|nr:5-formyltetrahydrofolate cyclo-ligase [Lachnospiraceae bacterium]